MRRYRCCIGASAQRREGAAWAARSRPELFSALLGRGQRSVRGQPPVLLFAGAVTGARLAAQELVRREPGRSCIDTLDEVLTRLESGIPLAEPPLPG